MYPADDIQVLLGLTARRNRTLQEDIERQLARIQALYERAKAVPSHAAFQESAAEIIRAAHRTMRASQELIEAAREHERDSRLLVQRSRSRRGGPA